MRVPLIPASGSTAVNDVTCVVEENSFSQLLLRLNTPYYQIIALTSVPALNSSKMSTIELENRGTLSFISPIVITAVPVLARKSTGASRA